MEKKNDFLRVGPSSILWGIIGILMCTTPNVRAIDYNGGGTYNVTGTINENVFIEDNGTIVNFNATLSNPWSVYVCFWGSTGATLNFGVGAAAYYVVAYSGSNVNLYNGTIDYAISVFAGANVNVFGTSFTVAGDPTVHYPGETLSINAVLTAYDANGEQLFTGQISCAQDASISLEAVGLEELTIDIKPGSYPNSINLGSNGVIPVAILSTADFDATTLNPENIFLAGSGVRVRGKGNKYLASEEDVNGDGLTDLVVKVETVNLDPGEFADGGAYLRVHETEEQTSPVLYEGWDEITIVPPKKGHSHGSRKKGRRRHR